MHTASTDNLSDCSGGGVCNMIQIAATGSSKKTRYDMEGPRLAQLAGVTWALRECTSRFLWFLITVSITTLCVWRGVP